VQTVRRVAIDGTSAVLAHPFVPYILILAALLQSL
jgi:hypothetical protein